MTEDVVRIPVGRIKALVGEGGATKRKIEERCGVDIEVDADGEVGISGDAADVFFAKDIIRAIGRGFAAGTALRLMDSGSCLYIIQLKEHAHTDKAVARIKGRVIGENGKIKAQIEEGTDSFLSIYGSTVSIISGMDTMEYAKEAVRMIIKGAMHGTVLAYLSKAKREIVESRLKGE